MGYCPFERWAGVGRRWRRAGTGSGRAARHGLAGQAGSARAHGALGRAGRRARRARAVGERAWRAREQARHGRTQGAQAVGAQAQVDARGAAGVLLGQRVVHSVHSSCF